MPLDPDINPINAELFIALGTCNEIKLNREFWIRFRICFYSQYTLGGILKRKLLEKLFGEMDLNKLYLSTDRKRFLVVSFCHLR